jgi:hypothetical protein
MKKQALVVCSGEDIAALMQLLEKLFGGYAAAGECSLLLCMVGVELIKKFERENWQWSEDYKSAIDGLKELAESIASEVYSANKDSPSFS